MNSAASDGIQTFEDDGDTALVSQRPKLPSPKTRLDKLLALRGGLNHRRRRRSEKDRVPPDQESSGAGGSLSSLQGHEAQSKPLTANGSNAADFSKDA